VPLPTEEETARIREAYTSLYSTFETKESPDNPLLLAHYTSVQVVEQILKNCGEVWFSNPLNMNDLDELRAGVFMGLEIFPGFAQQAATTPARASILLQNYNHYFAHLSTEAALDTYVFCLCEHPSGDTDGRLSMWREYGSKGNGAALVFNTQRIKYFPYSPLIIAKVNYKSRAEREAALRKELSNWASITSSLNLPDDHLFLAALAAFGLMKSMALVTKHTGFREESEWRVVYVPERDPLGYFKSCLGYFVGPRGVEPKFKIRLGKVYEP
jgi:hypothetical protein